MNSLSTLEGYLSKFCLPFALGYDFFIQTLGSSILKGLCDEIFFLFKC
jgi:hypothetical protein